MFVDSGANFLNSQSSYKKNNDRFSSDDKRNFDDLLAQSNRKKKTSHSKNDKLTSRKKDDHSRDLGDGQDNKIEDRRPLSTKGREQSSTPSRQSERVEKAETSQSRQTVVKQQEQTKPEEVSVNSGAFKNLNVQENQASDHVSINQSAVDKKTLEKNENLVSDLQNSFESMMAKVKQQSTNGKTGIGQGNPLNISSEGKMKLDSSFKMNENLETLELGTENSLSGLKSVTGAGESKENQDQSANLDSMFAQFMEDQQNVGETETSAFADELTQVEGNGGQQKIENMQSIIKQARAFVDDGGGSMEIHLQPEGLGKVQLKVAVQEGQVNVEMLTDNAAAKKALEEGLFDIKNALEGQKLLVETLKVEMTPDYQKDFSDLENHMQEQANRDFAEQFLDQFQQQREEKFGGMFDGFKNFQRGAMEPEMTLQNRNPYTENGKGRTLNVVA